MSTRNKGRTGVILMTYGSATTAEHVRVYLEHIYGRGVPLELVAEFENRYRLAGGSPLVRITTEQAALLERKLGARYVVRAGMRHSAPFIEQAAAACVAEGATSLVGIILSPQFSPLIMGGYIAAFQEAAHAHGINNATIADPWPTEEHFIELLARRTKNALQEIKKKEGVDARVVFTTHSLPRRIVDKDISYLDQLRATIEAIRTKLGPSLVWCAAYQSAGHTKEEWLKPDLVDIFAELRGRNTSAVLIVPIQFLADHLEVLSVWTID